MKEYIEKRELIEQIEHERDMWGEDYDAEQILGDIEDMQTATQADIESLAYSRGARAFARKLLKDICVGCGYLDGTKCGLISCHCVVSEHLIVEKVDELLKEMGCDND